MHQPIEKTSIDKPLEMQASMNGGPTVHDGADTTSQELAEYYTEVASADADILPEHEILAARTTNLVDNNAWVSNAINKKVEGIIGNNLRLSYKPQHALLNITVDVARDFSKSVEARWKSYCNDPEKWGDITRKHTVPHLFEAMYRAYETNGEMLALIHQNNDARIKNKTAFQLIDCARLKTPDAKQESKKLKAGIEFDKNGAATAYYILESHPNDYANDNGMGKYKKLPRETKWGRPVVIHLVNDKRIGQTRGISDAVKIIEATLMDNKLHKAELGAAILNAMLGVYIESPFDRDLADEMQDKQKLTNLQTARAEYHKQKSFSMSGNKLGRLFPGEKVTSIEANRPGGEFEAFQRSVMRKLAAALGITYEQMTGDWSKVTYSSARAALNEIWRSWVQKREKFTRNVCTPMFGAWFEYELHIGGLTLPAGAKGFYEEKSAWLNCLWIGPGKGNVDPRKETQAIVEKMAAGLLTQEQATAEIGGDFEENMDSIAREIAAQPENVAHPATLNYYSIVKAHDDQNAKDDEPKGDDE